MHAGSIGADTVCEPRGGARRCSSAGRGRVGDDGLVADCGDHVSLQGVHCGKADEERASALLASNAAQGSTAASPAAAQRWVGAAGGTNDEGEAGGTTWTVRFGAGGQHRAR
jgi:hypothetical protein